MRYDVRLSIIYEYPRAAETGRHLLCLTPPNLPGEQTVIASRLKIDPRPDERLERRDFFQNPIAEVAFYEPLERSEFLMLARIERHVRLKPQDVSPPLERFEAEIAGYASVEPEAPHHFLAPSPRAPADPLIAQWAADLAAGKNSVYEIAVAIGEAIYEQMAYDPEATNVDTPASVAFEAKRGVCQDFSHIMIVALRSLRIPAAYVSGFLRTIPPEGAERLEGADAMHAWVRIWCGREMGWVEYDPTNALNVGTDHIVIARGRDYDDVAPVRGVMRMAGEQRTEQGVDVIPLD
ncbi:transglutaminase family protein [Neomegalonema perideroedes]|uniref:transglutaminase family protein n=1 Tax=Neomegalonema perideroedes TaxID=217219 RepID=UPI00036EED26|nr:transglutaminase family protein [Neomegalonema perideroedes]